MAFIADAHSPGLAQGGNSLLWRDQTGKLSGLPDHAWHVDGLFRALDCAASWLWNILSSFATGRVEDGFSPARPQLGSGLHLMSFLSADGVLPRSRRPCGAGWTQYPPLSAIASAGPGQGLGTDFWLVSIGLFCLSSLMSATGFLMTTIKLRAPGMTWMRMPLTCWSWFVTSILILLAFSILLVALVLLMLDRHAGTSFLFQEA